MLSSCLTWTSTATALSVSRCCRNLSSSSQPRTRRLFFRHLADTRFGTSGFTNQSPEVNSCPSRPRLDSSPSETCIWLRRKSPTATRPGSFFNDFVGFYPPLTPPFACSFSGVCGTQSSMQMRGLKNRGVFCVPPTPSFDSSFSGCWGSKVAWSVRGGGGFFNFGLSLVLELERHWRIRRAGNL